jgi:DNA repair protein RadC
MKDIPNVDRPREKFLAKGPDALTKSELLAIVLGSGIKGTNVKVLAQRIMRKFGNAFLYATVDELKKIPGIGQAKALQIVSAFALARRIEDEQSKPENIIRSPEDAVSIVSNLKDAKRENLVCLYLNARNGLIKKETVSIGTLDRSIVHPREIFATGIVEGAARVIVVHNHPSGDPEPSEQDKEAAKRIAKAGNLMGVEVLDFLIVAKNGFHSLAGELRNSENLEYVAEGYQSSLFDLIVDADIAAMSYAPARRRASSPKKKRKPTTDKKWKFIDLFAGIGGFHAVFHNVGLVKQTMI